jgi:thiamine biosynthesis lipoprotein
MIENGVEQAIINLGGNVVAIGEKNPGEPWVVGIERPYSDRTAIVGALAATDETVTTSGVYERYFEKNGNAYHHVLDPETGYPMETSVEAVTVQGPCGMSAESDAFGTMFLMLGQEASGKILKEYPEFKAAFISKDDSVEVVNGLEILPVE